MTQLGVSYQWTTVFWPTQIYMTICSWEIYPLITSLVIQDSGNEVVLLNINTSLLSISHRIVNLAQFFQLIIMTDSDRCYRTYAYPDHFCLYFAIFCYILFVLWNMSWVISNEYVHDFLKRDIIIYKHFTTTEHIIYVNLPNILETLEK